MKKIKYIILLFIVPFSFLLTSCVEKTEVIKSKNGFVKWNNNSELAILNGEWLLYENELYTPSDLKNAINKPKLTKVPSYLGKEVSHGTYVLTVELPDDKIGKELALHLPKIYTAYRIWVNGALKKESGKVSSTKKGAFPLGKAETLHFVSSKQAVEIVLQVSNFHHRKTGISGLVTLGTHDEVENVMKLRLIITWFTFGALAVLSLIQLLFFFHKRNKKIHLFLGVFCALIAFRGLLKGEEDIFFILEDLRWIVSVKLDYTIIFASIFFFSMYMSQYFPKYKIGTIAKLNSFITSGCILLIILFPANVFTHLINVFYLLLLINTFYFGYLIIKGIQQGVEGAKVIGSMFGILLATVVLDILYNNILVNTTVQTTSLGLIIFFTGQSFVETRRYVTALESEAMLLKEIENTNREVVFTLGEITETRSKETGNHVRRVAEYCYLLAIKYGLTDEEAELLKLASPLHDIGKVAIPDHILQKPGKLTSEEFEVIKTHTTIGYQMLKYSNRELIKVAATIAYTHHEKYNGDGYPRGLIGDNIPLFGRITAIADVFDALSNDRIYKRAWKKDKIIAYFDEEKGRHFDPELATIFLDNIDDFIKINEMYSDK